MKVSTVGVTAEQEFAGVCLGMACEPQRTVASRKVVTPRAVFTGKTLLAKHESYHNCLRLLFAKIRVRECNGDLSTITADAPGKTLAP